MEEDALGVLGRWQLIGHGRRRPRAIKRRGCVRLGWQRGGHSDQALLRAMAKVVVASGHECVRPWLEAQQPEVDGCRRLVELLAVGSLLVVVGVGGAPILLDKGKLPHERKLVATRSGRGPRVQAHLGCHIEHARLRRGQRHVRVDRSNLNNVVPVLVVGALAVVIAVVVRVVVARPLNVHEVVRPHRQGGRGEAIRKGGECLSPITTLAEHVQVVDESAGSDARRALYDRESVRAVLKRSPKAVRGHGQLQQRVRAATHVQEAAQAHSRVVIRGGRRRAPIVRGAEVEARPRMPCALARGLGGVARMRAGLQLGWRDVVAQPKCAVLLCHLRHPHGRPREPAHRPRRYQALGRCDAKGRLRLPRPTLRNALRCADGLLHAKCRGAVPARLNILRVHLEVLAPLWRVGDDRQIAPGSRCPVGVVVSLFRTLESSARAGRVLPCRGRAVAVQVLVGRVQALVAFTLHARLVKRRRLVQAAACLRSIYSGRSST